MSLLHHRSDISRKVHKSSEKAENLSSRSHRLEMLHVLRDWCHVIYIFSKLQSQDYYIEVYTCSQ